MEAVMGVLLFLFKLRLLLPGVDAQTGATCDAVPVPQRLDCHPEPFASEEACRARKCCWSLLDKDRTIACFFPANYPTYEATSLERMARGLRVEAKRSKSAYPVPDPIDKIRLEVVYETASRLRISITDPSKMRWQPPIELGAPEQERPLQLDYLVEVDISRLGVRVKRNNGLNTTLADSTNLMASALVYGDQFLQMAFAVNAQHGFGLGEREDTFPLDLHDWRRMFFWARDQVPHEDANLYGVHNFLLGLASDGTSFGLFFLNSNAMEVVKQPAPSLTYRTLGGILDFFLFTGPQPADVVAQYYELIGRPPVPPYWALGFQLSRYGYENLTEIRATIERNKDAGVPLDVQWFDIDYMDRFRDWTVGEKFADLGTFIEKDLHNELGLHAVLIVDPAIPSNAGNDYVPYTSGLAMGVFINDSRSEKPLVGMVWPGETVYPDFLKNETSEWWFHMAKDFREKVPYDGLWIDMNEPANFNAGSLTGCDPANKLDYPPYVPPITDYSLFASTICPSALHQCIPHYNVHNMYALSEAKVTRDALLRVIPNQRPFLLTRSSFAGAGRYTYHWTGDVYSTWKALASSLVQILNFNLYAMPMVGADICGFVGDTTEELCVRWSQLGAFYPFARNHNGLGSRLQDPAVWSAPATQAIAKGFALRYQFLPYLYTLLYEANLVGRTVARALFLEFPHDLATHIIDKQFLWGSCLMVVPVLKEGARSVYAYLPEGRWVDVHTLRVFESRGQWFAVAASLDTIPLFYRGGCILPMHPAGAKNTAHARKMGIGLTAVLSEADGKQKLEEAGGTGNASAVGTLIWDDGVSQAPVRLHVSCSLSQRQLMCEPQVLDPILMEEPVNLAFVIIIGLEKNPAKMELNGTTVEFDYNKEQQVATVKNLSNVDLRFPLILTWAF
uniref:Lysosomal alpha-glucosidase n=1 Tax=Schistocephalus solidus TaxID=70667 RepID=A0A0X3PGG6_SCHSO